MQCFLERSKQESKQSEVHQLNLLMVNDHESNDQCNSNLLRAGCRQQMQVVYCLSGTIFTFVLTIFCLLTSNCWRLFFVSNFGFCDATLYVWWFICALDCARLSLSSMSMFDILQAEHNMCSAIEATIIHSAILNVFFLEKSHVDYIFIEWHSKLTSPYT